MIFSKGSLERVFLFADSVAKISVKPPIRPKNIRQINISFETRCNPGVMPRVSIEVLILLVSAIHERKLKSLRMSFLLTSFLGIFLNCKM